MVWDDAGLYILVVANDDFWFPYTGTGNEYEYDKIELYFDTNYILTDGVGGQAGSTGNRQISFAVNGNTTPLDGTVNSNDVLGGTVKWAYKVDEPKWTSEWFIPWESIPDKDGVLFDKTAQMGFDVDITDRDPDDAARKRAMWANVGAIDENWGNMDDAGYITFEGAEAGIYVDGITLSGSDITTDNGTIQLSAVVEPADATNQMLKWEVTSGTDKVSISKDGVVTAIKNGTVTIKALATDGGWAESNELTINISGQVLTLAEISYLKNGNFDKTTATGGPENWDNGTVTDGILNFGPASVLTNQWDYHLQQVTHIPFELKDEDFVLSFKAWADEPRTLPLVFEDAFNDGAQWDAYASSTDPGWSDKTWTVNLTTEPTVFSMHLNFSPMKETTQQNFNFQVGLNAAQIHMDSIYLVRSAELALVSARSLASAKSKVQLYPNPVQTELTVSKIAVANSKVAIYNSLGQKLMEKVATGNIAKFDVANLRKGMYFVKLSDGTTQKFIR
jgi:uncharacterized protein YjdB